MCDIWEVVSSLAHALMGARNQLVGLMSTTPTFRRRQSRPCTRSCTPTCRHCCASHGHVGHVPFGSGSECCKPVIPPNPKKCPRTSRLAYQKIGHCYTRCRNVPNLERPNSPTCDRSREGVQLQLLDDTVNISFSKSNPCREAKQDSNKCCHEPLPKCCRRYCIGTEYAHLLRDEACRWRERRLQEECRPKYWR